MIARSTSDFNSAGVCSVAGTVDGVPSSSLASIVAGIAVIIVGVGAGAGSGEGTLSSTSASVIADVSVVNAGDRVGVGDVVGVGGVPLVAVSLDGPCAANAFSRS